MLLIGEKEKIYLFQPVMCWLSPSFIRNKLVFASFKVIHSNDKTEQLKLHICITFSPLAYSEMHIRDLIGHPSRFERVCVSVYRAKIIVIRALWEELILQRRSFSVASEFFPTKMTFRSRKKSSSFKGKERLRFFDGWHLRSFRVIVHDIDV